MANESENRGSEPSPAEDALVEARAVSTPSPGRDHGSRNRVLRIRITDVDTGRLKVGLSLPVSLVSVATRLGARLVPPSHNAADLVAAIERADHSGPIVVDDEQNGERVEISVER